MTEVFKVDDEMCFKAWWKNNEPVKCRITNISQWLVTVQPLEGNPHCRAFSWETLQQIFPEIADELEQQRIDLVNLQEMMMSVVDICVWWLWWRCCICWKMATWLYQVYAISSGGLTV